MLTIISAPLVSCVHKSFPDSSDSSRMVSYWSITVLNNEAYFDNDRTISFTASDEAIAISGLEDSDVLRSYIGQDIKLQGEFIPGNHACSRNVRGVSSPYTYSTYKFKVSAISLPNKK